MVHFIDDFPINTSIYKGFSMAMLNNQMITLPGKKKQKTCDPRHAASQKAQSSIATRWCPPQLCLLVYKP